MDNKLKKICFLCKIEKKSIEFNKDKSKKDGLCSYCKECRKPLLKAWSITHRKEHNEQSGKWEKNNKDKKRAHGAVRLAIKKGILKKYNCVICNSSDSEAHHSDYSKLLDVIWLCPLHHKYVHINKITVMELCKDFGDCHLDGESGCDCVDLK
mgnify:CR=1 FL=1